MGMTLPIVLICAVLLFLLFLLFQISFVNKKTNDVQKFVGKEAKVCEKNENGFMVKLNGTKWNIENIEDTTNLHVGDTVVIQSVAGIKLMVTKKW